MLGLGTGPAGVLVAAAPAVASCDAPVEPLRLPERGLVLAGRVEATSNDGRAADVTVPDVWAGQDLPPRVVVVGGRLAPNVASSVDRTYRDGASYAFLVHETGGGVLLDYACTSTAPLSGRVAPDPPGSARPSPGPPHRSTRGRGVRVAAARRRSPRRRGGWRSGRGRPAPRP